jgi:hypothetical protein
MAAIFQIRRGTTNASLTEGELYLHQGSGSLQFGSGSNSYNTLTLNAPVRGDINLIGNISASGDVRIGGNIYLGDSAASDNISALGLFTTNLVPAGLIDLGTTSAKWNNVYANNISGAIAATNGVVSGSSQIISILTSLNTFSGSQLTQNTTLAAISGSLISTASTNVISVTNLNTFSGSQLTQNTALATISGSLISTASNHEQRLGQIESKSGSYDTRFNSLATISGSLISTASVNVVSITALNLYTSSLQQAITASGANLTINGNLTVKGTTTQIDSTTLAIGDNIIELNGTGIANAGLQIKDPTGGSTLSGSLLWDSANDYWKAGTLSNESKLLRAGGDSIISSSVQLTELNSFTGSQLTQNNSLASITGSLISTASANVISITNLNTFSSSVQDRFTSIVTITGSLILTASANTISITNINTITASLNTSITSINNFTSSQLTQNTTLSNYTASVNQTISSLNLYTASANAWSGTIDTRFTILQQVTSSLILATGSLFISASRMTASIYDHENRITYVEGLNGISGGNPLTPLNLFSASINTFTSSANIRLNNIEAATSSYETKGRGIWSGSAQLPAGIVSGSSQTIANLPNGTVSGSSQVLGGTGIVSGSTQITPLLPVGTISGSAQVGSGSAHAYVAAIYGTANQVLVAGNNLNSAIITLSTPQDIATTSNVQHASLGIGMVASGTAGRVDASGDIVAYSTSDINFKENIVPIKNALDKVENISGNEYIWKNEFEYIHGFKGNDVGVIAQEIQKVLPEAVRERENGYLGVNYEKIIPLLIQSIKELSAKVKELEKK